jgi:hypothetical protein
MMSVIAARAVSLKQDLLNGKMAAPPRQPAPIDAFKRVSGRTDAALFMDGPLTPGHLQPPDPTLPYPNTAPIPLPANPPMNREEAIKIADPVMDSMAVGTCTAIGAIGGPLGGVVGAGVGLAIVGVSRWWRRH